MHRRSSTLDGSRQYHLQLKKAGLPMVFCSGCGHQIHETAISCPNCGMPQPRLTAQQDNATQIGKSPQTEPFWAAITSLVIGLIAITATLDDSKWDGETLYTFLICSMSGFVLGIVSLNISNRGKKIALTGAVLSVIALILCFSQLP